MSDDCYEGPERREGYEELGRKLEVHAEHIEKRFTKWFRAGLVAFAVMGLAVTVSLIGYGLALREVQDQRRDVCESQNERHDAAVARFRELANEAKKRNPERSDEIEASIQGNLRILDALVPVQDCDKAVQKIA